MQLLFVRYLAVSNWPKIANLKPAQHARQTCAAIFRQGSIFVETPLCRCLLTGALRLWQAHVFGGKIHPHVQGIFPKASVYNPLLRVDCAAVMVLPVHIVTEHHHLLDQRVYSFITDFQMFSKPQVYVRILLFGLLHRYFKHNATQTMLWHVLSHGLIIRTVRGQTCHKFRVLNHEQCAGC